MARCRTFIEIAVIFAVFAFQGGWPVPDVNETHYLGKAIHYWNPDWAGGDFFLQSKDPGVIFDICFGWLSLWLAPTALAWTGRILTWWLLAWAWRRFSNAALSKPWWSIISAAIFVTAVERCHMAGEWIIGGVEPKGFAYIFVLLALEALLKNGWNRVWIFTGLAAGLHVLVGGWTAVAMVLTWLMLGQDRPGLRTMWSGILVGAVLMLPGLMPALLLNVSTEAAVVRQANLLYVFERLPHHLDIFQIQPNFILRFLLMIATFFLLAWKTSGGDSPNNQSALGRLVRFVISAMAIAMVGFIINLTMFINRDFAAGLLRYYWFRLADVAVPMGAAILLCRWMVQCWNKQPFLGRIVAGLVGFAVFCHLCSVSVDRLMTEGPRLERLPNTADWQSACVWASDIKNTPATARFITPRLSRTFKWYAHRGEIATWKDIPQDAESIVQWWNRMHDLYDADGDDPEYRWQESLNERGTERLIQLGQKYTADYVIAETVDEPLDLLMVYQNPSYTIYKLHN